MKEACERDAIGGALEDDYDPVTPSTSQIEHFQQR